MNNLDSNRLITSAQVRAIFGGISDMSLWRWINDPELNFPKPSYIQRRRFFDATEIEDFRACTMKKGNNRAA